MHIILKIGLFILILGVGPLVFLILLHNLGLIDTPGGQTGTPVATLGFIAMATFPISCLFILLGIILSFLKWRLKK